MLEAAKDRVSQLFDIVKNDEDYEIKIFNFYAEKAKLKFPEEEDRDLIFARLCHIQVEQLNEDKINVDKS